MLTILLGWLYMALLCILFGVLVLSWTGEKSEPLESVPLPAVMLTGLATIGVLLAYLSLCTGIGALAHLIVLGSGLALAWIRRLALRPMLGRLMVACKTVHWRGAFVFGLLTLGLALKNAVVQRNTLGELFFHYDTGLYHAQSIRWIEQYGTVPGLGNLLPPLAYDSLWFQPCALFSFSFVLSAPLHALTGFAALCGFAYALAMGAELIAGEKPRFSHAVGLLAVVPLIEIAANSISPVTDEPAAIYTLVGLAVWCRGIEQAAAGRDSRALDLSAAVLLVFAVGIKWSVLPLLIAVGWLALQALLQGERRASTVLVALGATMLLPKFLRSVLLSGYLIYPVPVDLFAVDWKVPLRVVSFENRFIQSWSRIPDRPADEVLAGGFLGWFPTWFANFRTLPVAVALFVALAVFLVIGIGRLRVHAPLIRRYAPVYLTVGVGLAYWFLAAPYPRYGYAFLTAATIFLLAPSLVDLLGLGQPWLVRGGLTLQTACGALLALVITYSIAPQGFLGTGFRPSDDYVVYFKRIFKGINPPDALVWQEQYPAVPVLLLPVGNTRLYRPVRGEQCWAAPLPCTPYLNTAVARRGPSLKDGFRPVDGPVGDFDGRRIARERGQSP